MVNMDFLETDFCSEYIYDEECLDFLIKYDSDLQSVYERLEPNCVSVINSQFALAYVRNSNSSFQEMLRYGYNVVPKCYGLLDASTPESLGVPRVQNLPGLELSGRDVLIGFVDTGIDYRHPVFQRVFGLRRESRILAIWDQTKEAYDQTEGRKSVFGYGAEYRQREIQEAINAENPFEIVPSKDAEGHGTFLASVACGSDYEDDANFYGIAPQADILMVKLKPVKRRLRDFFLIPEEVPCYSEGDIILGIKYLIQKAVEFGKPLIICLGIGTNQGDHNGNTNLELYLDTIANLRGVCVVTAGGNELGAGGHFRGNDSISSLSPVDVAELYVGENEKGFSMEIWGNAPSLLRVSVLSPTGERFQGLASGRDNGVMTTFLYEGTTLYAESIVVEQNSGDPFVLLRFVNPGPGIWNVQVEELGSSVVRGFDVWLPLRQYLAGDTRFASPDAYITLCAPGNSRGVITMESYNHYDKSLYVNSSRGYTRKGRIKPDLVGPGVDVFGAFPGGSRALFTTKSGSSVASACGAGLACLLMEWGLVRGNNYGMNTEVIRQMFLRGARSVANTSYPNPSWGWGVIDIYQTFEVMRNNNS